MGTATLAILLAICLGVLAVPMVSWLVRISFAWVRALARVPVDAWAYIQQRRAEVRRQRAEAEAAEQRAQNEQLAAWRQQVETAAKYRNRDRE